MGEKEDFGQEKYGYVDDEHFKCPTCKGTGWVNELTCPPDFFCAGMTDCPHCDGTGEI